MSKGRESMGQKKEHLCTAQLRDRAAVKIPWVTLLTWLRTAWKHYRKARSQPSSEHPHKTQVCCLWVFWLFVGIFLWCVLLIFLVLYVCFLCCFELLLVFIVGCFALAMGFL